MTLPSISDGDFQQVQKFIFEEAGISFGENKKYLVSARLASRLTVYGLNDFGHYIRLIKTGEYLNEKQLAVDALTTNETSFFREAKHFDLLKNMAYVPSNGDAFRVWSAACSYGQEPYSIAMTLAEVLGNKPWEVFATDISSKVLKVAKEGKYNSRELPKIPRHYQAKFCSLSEDKSGALFEIRNDLRQRVEFMQGNQNGPPFSKGCFDVIFLRNVMIYFDQPTRAKLLEQLQKSLKKGGFLITGLSETLHGVYDGLKLVSPSVYQNV